MPTHHLKMAKVLYLQPATVIFIVLCWIKIFKLAPQRAIITYKKEIQDQHASQKAKVTQF